METRKSQAQIAWDRHEELSNQLKAVQGDLARAKEAHAKEERDFRLHRRSNDELLLKMHTGSSKIVEALAELKVRACQPFRQTTPIPSGSTLHSWGSWLHLLAASRRA